jgi:hypothetical protein
MSLSQVDNVSQLPPLSSSSSSLAAALASSTNSEGSTPTPSASATATIATVDPYAYRLYAVLQHLDMFNISHFG